MLGLKSVYVLINCLNCLKNDKNSEEPETTVKSDLSYLLNVIRHCVTLKCILKKFVCVCTHTHTHTHTHMCLHDYLSVQDCYKLFAML